MTDDIKFTAEPFALPAISLIYASKQGAIKYWKAGASSFLLMFGERSDVVWIVNFEINEEEAFSFGIDGMRSGFSFLILYLCAFI
ncbi:hypothetical protein CEXT_686881 [Caerostris extrusa]|uniref:Uncharacterized protein n=1 Tax=Caerostris extrusa TaxID=172846 RepID=A0AAV4TAM5_CAEEX|nr:hypothetical protein CEXT_686881 [Caerostris extrusa]